MANLVGVPGIVKTVARRAAGSAGGPVGLLLLGTALTGWSIGKAGGEEEEEDAEDSVVVAELRPAIGALGDSDLSGRGPFRWTPAQARIYDTIRSLEADRLNMKGGTPGTEEFMGRYTAWLMEVGLSARSAREDFYTVGEKAHKG